MTSRSDIALIELNVRCVVFMRAVNVASNFEVNDGCPNDAQHAYSSHGMFPQEPWMCHIRLTRKSNYRRKSINCKK